MCSGTVDETVAYASVLHEEIIRPAMSNSQQLRLAECMLKGLHISNPLFDSDAFRAYFRKTVVGENILLERWWSRAVESLTSFIFGCLYRYQVIGVCLRVVLNYLLKLNLHITKRWMKSVISYNQKLYEL